METYKIYPFISLILLLNCSLALGQIEVVVKQPKCNKKWVCISNNPQYIAQQLDGNTQSFIIDTPKEPIRLTLIIDSLGYQHEDFWVEPDTKIVNCMLYACKHYHFSIQKPNILTKEERTNQLYIEYLQNKYSEENYLKLYNEFLIGYIKQNPSSFLSLDYLNRMTIDNTILQELLNILEPYHKQYPTFQKLIGKLKYAKTPQVGEVIQEFNARYLNGKPFNITEIEKKPTVFVFWQTSCSYSRKCMPHLSELDNKYKNVNFVYYCLDENRQQWENSTKDYQLSKYNLSNLDGFNGITPLSLGVSATPYFIVLDKDRKIEMITFGNELPLVEKTLEGLLKPK